MTFLFQLFYCLNAQSVSPRTLITTLHNVTKRNKTNFPVEKLSFDLM